MFSEKLRLLALLALGASLAAGTATAGDAAAGAAKAAACAACHGPTGTSPLPDYPNLAGQNAEYIAEQLAFFKAGVRANPVMQPMAALLSPADAADVAAYFASQTPTGREADPSLVALGQKLYRSGDAARGIPACLACHGPDGRGNAPAKWPALRAQYASYAYAQLKAYAANARYGAKIGDVAPPDRAAMMQTISARLSDDEMKALASYVQGLR
jgi:cytochrome c553